MAPQQAQTLSSDQPPLCTRTASGEIIWHPPDDAKLAVDKQQVFRDALGPCIAKWRRLPGMGSWIDTTLRTPEQAEHVRLLKSDERVSAAISTKGVIGRGCGGEAELAVLWSKAVAAADAEQQMREVIAVRGLEIIEAGGMSPKDRQRAKEIFIVAHCEGASSGQRGGTRIIMTNRSMQSCIYKRWGDKVALKTISRIHRLLTDLKVLRAQVRSRWLPTIYHLCTDYMKQLVLPLMRRKQAPLAQVEPVSYGERLRFTAEEEELRESEIQVQRGWREYDSWVPVWVRHPGMDTGAAREERKRLMTPLWEGPGPLDE